MRTLFILFLLLNSSYCEEKRETGQPGGSLNIKCSYQDHHAERPKYFCKTIDDRGCDIIASSEQPTPQRLNLTEYKQQGHFLVTLSELTDKDTGVYLCAVGGASSTDKIELLQEVFISVDPVYGDEGGSATFRCPYRQGYQNNSKGLCKGDLDCKSDNMLIKSGQTQAKDTQFHLYDNTTARVFSVTFRALKTKYSGKYICAVQTGGTYVHTKQELVVRKVMAGEVGGSVNITCNSQKDPSKKLKYCQAKNANDCKLLVTSLSPKHDRYSLTEHEHGQIFTVTITDLRAEDAGIYQCGQAETYTEVRLRVNPGSSPIILPVLLIVVVIVLATAVFLLYRHRRNKTQEFSSNNGNTSNDRQIPQPDCMYEEIKDTHNPSDTAHPEMSTVYSTAQLPTMPSDDPTHCTAELHTNPCASMDYSTVSFSKGPDTAAVTLRQENCEYSTIDWD